MATGETTTDILDNSLPSLRQQARIIQEYKGVMTQLVDRVRLGEGQGNTWNEVSLGKLTAVPITENTRENNPQQLSDSIISVTPQVISVHTVITDRTERNIARVVWRRTGPLGQNAIERKKDEDGLTQLDSFSASQPGAGSTLTSGHIAAGAFNIRGNTTEPWDGAIAVVLHSFQIKDLFDELIAGVGTYPVPEGSTAEVFKGGWTLPIAGAQVFPDDNLGGFIDGSDDVKGGMFASGRGGAIILCQARAPWMKRLRDEKFGGGATELLHRDEYAYLERNDVWGRELLSDATAPTS